jgi:ABC-type Fe3+/spermidine/putrescine transport system ATPase subunit
MRWELKELQRRTGITFVYVTHDQSEAIALSDRIAVMHAGEIMQVGAPREVYARPVNKVVADFMGLVNLIPGRVVSSAPAPTTGSSRSDASTRSTRTCRPASWQARPCRSRSAPRTCV